MWLLTVTNGHESVQANAGRNHRNSRRERGQGLSELLFNIVDDGTAIYEWLGKSAVDNIENNVEKHVDNTPL